MTEYKFFYGDRVIFTAFCADGWVIEVHDYRKQNDRAPQKPNSGSQKTNSSGPNVGDFVHPDDFYDWDRDDFADFEEAGDYYYSHGGR